MKEGEVALQLQWQIKRMNLRISYEKVKNKTKLKPRNFCYLYVWGTLTQAVHHVPPWNGDKLQHHMFLTLEGLQDP